MDTLTKVNVIVFCNQKNCKFYAENVHLFVDDKISNNAKCFHPSPKISHFGTKCKSKEEKS